MLYIIDTQGTTQAVITEPVYKGSVGVNNITLLAPFPANTQILVNAILPNGMALRNLYPMKAVVLPVELQNINKKNYTAFSCTIDESLTLYSGTVQVQFQLINGFMPYVTNGQTKLKPRVLATYTTGFAVGEGVNIESISINDIGDQDYMRAILGLLSEINSDPIKSIEYRNPNFLINSKLGNEASVTVVPSNYLDYHSDTGLTIDGMNNSNNRESFFNKFSDTESAGFKIDLGEVYNVGILQLFVWSKVTELTLEIKFEGGNETINRTVTVSPTTQSIPIITRLFANVEARYITIESSEYFDITGVQIYESNNYGEYVITQNSGAESILPVPTIAVDYFLSSSSTNPVQNRVITEALNGKQNALTFDTTPTQGSQNPVTSGGIWSMNEATRNELRQEIENIAIPNIYYESNFIFALGAVLSTPSIKANDIIIITAKGAPDLVVFNANGQPGAGATVITDEQIYNGTVPTPQAGDRFIVANTGLGVICLESGIVEPNIKIDDALSESSTNPVQNKVVYEAIEDTKKSIPVTTFCSSFAEIVYYCFSNEALKSGDWLIDTTKDTVDFIVCNSNYIGDDYTSITKDEFDNGILPPPPSAGAKYTFYKNGEALPIGIIAIEGGKVTPVATGSEKYTRIQSSTLTKDMVVSWQLDKKLKKILITVTSPAANIPEFALTGKTWGGYWESVIYLPAGTSNTALIEGEILVPGLVSRTEVYLGDGGGTPKKYYTNTNNFLKGDYYDGFRTTSACGAGTTITVYGVEI